MGSRKRNPRIPKGTQGSLGGTHGILRGLKGTPPIASSWDPLGSLGAHGDRMGSPEGPHGTPYGRPVLSALFYNL